MKFWIARNQTGTLLLWFNKPIKQGESWYSNDGFFILDEEMFPEVTFGNSPQEVELKLVNDMASFAKDLLTNCKPLEGEFSKFVDDNFNELI